MRLVIAIWCLMLALVDSGAAGVARAPGDQVEEGVRVCLLAGGGAEPLGNSNGSRRTSAFAPSSHSEGMRYSFVGGIHDHSRGDVVGQTDGGGSVTWEAAYEGFGKRTAQDGTATGRQRANTKDEDATGLLNEGHRYRCLETGVFLTRDPAGFVDGPNVYSYVRQNPWTMFDPLGLALSILHDGSGSSSLRADKPLSARVAGDHLFGGTADTDMVRNLPKLEVRDMEVESARQPAQTLEWSNHLAMRLWAQQAPLEDVDHRADFGELSPSTRKMLRDTSQARSEAAHDGEILAGFLTGIQIIAPTPGKISGIFRAGKAPRTTEFMGIGTQHFASDLSHVTGKAAASRNRAIAASISEDLPNLRLTYTPQYNPWISQGVAQRGAGTQIGRRMFESRATLRNTIVHEELHHRWWKRGFLDHHPRGSAKEAKFYETIRRYERMRGWTE